MSRKTCCRSATSKWVIASGMGEGAGISIIDSEAKTARRFYTGTAKPDLKMYPDCATAPASFNSHGIALAADADGGHLHALFRHPSAV